MLKSQQERTASLHWTEPVLMITINSLKVINSVKKLPKAMIVSINLFSNFMNWLRWRVTKIIKLSSIKILKAKNIKTGVKRRVSIFNLFKKKISSSNWIKTTENSYASQFSYTKMTPWTGFNRQTWRFQK